MSQHVYVRLVGFQLTVVPRAPFRIDRADHNALDVECSSPDGLLFARLIPHEGGFKSQLDQSTSSLHDVVDVKPGPQTLDWMIETSFFTCRWPAGYSIQSNNYPRDPAPFDLVGQHRELIYVQTPDHLPDVAELRAANQTVIGMQQDDRSNWIDLQYNHDGEAWRQRHEIIHLEGRRVCVTMQSPSDFANDALVAAQQVVKSLAPYQAAP